MILENRTWPVAPIHETVEERENWNPRKENRTHIEYLEISGIDNSSGKVVETKQI